VGGIVAVALELVFTEPFVVEEHIWLAVVAELGRTVVAVAGPSELAVGRLVAERIT
jgi:hypothetical protein